MQRFSQDFETISHFCGTYFFLLIMNKQEYNEHYLIISYFVLLVSKLLIEIEKLCKTPRKGTYSAS